MDKLGDFINNALSQKGLTAATTGSQVCFWADEWAKGAFTPISFSRGVLKVAVDSAAAAQELQMECEKLMNHLNNKAGKKIVIKVRIENHS